MVVELDEGDDVALQRAWLLVLHRRCDPLGPRRGSEGRRSPTFSRSHSWRSDTVDRRHSSAVISLTGIVLGTERRDKILTISPL